MDSGGLSHADKLQIKKILRWLVGVDSYSLVWNIARKIYTLIKNKLIRECFISVPILTYTAPMDIKIRTNHRESLVILVPDTI